MKISPASLRASARAMRRLLGLLTLGVGALNAQPVLVTQSALRQTITPGVPLLLAVTATGTGTLSYQWTHDGRPIPGATTSTYRVASFQEADAGRYAVTITDSTGFVRTPAMFVLHAPSRTEVRSWGALDQASVPPGLTDVVAVALGSQALALRADGTVATWGGDLSVPAGLNDVVAMSAGSHYLALRANGTVVAWGDNTYGQASVPVNLTDVVAVEAGSGCSLALRGDGTVVSWGSNSFSRQGTIPPGLDHVVQISAAGLTALALRDDGSGVGWGNNDHGQAGMPSAPSDMVLVKCGGYHSMGLFKDGTVQMWGYREYPLDSIPSNVRNVTGLAVGNFYSMALKADGTVVRWGFSQYGGTIPSDLNKVFAIAAGSDSGLAVRDATLDKQPVITAQPADRTVSPGTAMTLSVAADGGGAYLRYQWRKDGVALPGATSSSLTFLAVTAQDAGRYDVIVTDSLGTVTSAAATLVVTTETSHLVNIAARSYCGAGNNVTIGGFVVTGVLPKKVLVRAIGPTLVGQGLAAAEVLQDPQIELHDAKKGNVVIGSNDDWTTNANVEEIRTVGARIGAAPIDVGDTKSSALLLSLNPGVYTFVASAKTGGPGIVLIEVYDAD